MDPGAVQRLDDTKTILQVRSGYGAILNKMNFYTDRRFLQRRRDVESFTRHLVIPDLTIQPEWPLFEARAASLNTVEAVSDARRQFANDADVNGASNSSTDHDFEVLAAAMEVFADTTRFMHQFGNAMNAIDDQAIADLLFRLRTAPETFGGLHGNSDRFDRKGRRERKAAVEAVWRLREVVTAARWAKIADAMNAHVAAFTWSFVQGFAKSEGNDPFASDLVDVLPADSDVAVESNQLEIGHAQLSAVIDEISEMAMQEPQISPEAERANDKSRAIEAAVARMKRSTAAAILDDDQLPDAIQADNEDLDPPTPDTTNQQPDITE